MSTCRLCGATVPGADARAAMIAHVKALHVADGGAVNSGPRPSRHLEAVAQQRPHLTVVGDSGPGRPVSPRHPVFASRRQPDPTPAA